MSFKIGFHVGAGGDARGIGDYFKQLDQHAIPAILKSADHYGPCGELASLATQSGVPHLIIYRLSTRGTVRHDEDGNQIDFDVPDYTVDPAEAAEKHWGHTVKHLPPEFDKKQVWLEPINEIDKAHSDWLGFFALEFAQRAHQHGYKVTFFGWSSGEPEPADWGTEGMLAYLRLCAQKPKKTAISLHEYSYTTADITDLFPFKVGRFLRLLQTADSYRIRRPTIHMTEWGWALNDIPAESKALEDMRQVNELYSRYPEIKGAAIWWLGPGFGNVYQKVQKLIAPTAALALDETKQVPVKKLRLHQGKPREQYQRRYILLPGNADVDWALAVMRAEWDRSRPTVGGSADDGGIGDLEERTLLAINEAAWGAGSDGTGLAGFFATYYDGVVYQSLDATTPAELEQLLRDWGTSGQQEGGPLARFMTGITGLFSSEDDNRGVPREPYDRTYLLLSPQADLSWAEAAVRATWDQNRYTIGGSADDAGIGDLSVRRVIAVNPTDWESPGNLLRDFYHEHYPGVQYIPIFATTTEQLEQILRSTRLSLTVAPPTSLPGKVIHSFGDIERIDTQQPSGQTDDEEKRYRSVSFALPQLANQVEALAILVGKVITVDTNHPEYGNYLVLEHRVKNDFYRSWYTQLEHITVSLGADVQQGEILGQISRSSEDNSFRFDFMLQHIGFGETDPAYGMSDVIDPMLYIQW